MKKIFKFAALAALILPLIVACKPKNNPEDPNDPNNPQNWVDSVGTKAWYEDQITPKDSLQGPVTVQNVKGIWRIYAEAVLDYVQPEYGIIESNSFVSVDTTLIVLNDDFSAIEYAVTQMAFTNLGKWSLEGDTLIFPKQKHLVSEKNKIVVLEKDRLVLERKEDYGGIIYLLLHRFDKLPDVSDFMEVDKD